MLPDHNGVMTNYEYRPDLNWLAPYATESLDAVRRADAATQGHYLEAATVAEILQETGHSTIIAGAKPIALLHDRSAKKISQAQKDSVTLFAGQSLPRSVSETLTSAIDVGPFPTNRPPAPAAATNFPPVAQHPPLCPPDALERSPRPIRGQPRLWFENFGRKACPSIRCSG